MATKRITATQAFEIPASYLRASTKSKKAARRGDVIVFGVEDKNSLAQILQREAPTWKVKSPSFAEREFFQIERESGPLWILFRKRPAGPFSHSGRLEESDFAWFRDQAGPVLSQARASGVELLQIEFRGTESEAERGFLVGLELAAYSYKNLIQGKQFENFPQLAFKKSGGSFSKELVAEAALQGQAINLARHLVNIPPNFLNPSTVSQFVKKKFPKSPSLQVNVWDPKRLEKEGMGLHLGVGQGSPHGPCLVHLRYRPKVRRAPVALVGKGITFDTGGLDIKPSSGMRLMKKDMGGAAAVLATAFYVSQAKLALPMDFYVALAENSVDGWSMRPSDVLQARNGALVEIHNTDAEGRLVLADALDVAVTQKGADEPEFVIDVATLTGAIKTALGTEIAGLFSNHDDLAEKIEQAGRRAGDLSWRMPLYSRYSSSFSTAFGDMVNAVDGWAGSITAALFLEKFVRQKPWAHLDVYCWNDKASGALTFSGGSGQPVSCLIEFLTSESRKDRLS